MAAATLGRGEVEGRDAEALRTLLFRLADDELVHAERLTEWQVEAPTLESDLSISNVAQDEFGHARLWYDLLADFGYDEPDLIWERDPGEFRHASFVELPTDQGDWADTIARTYLYDVAEPLRLDAVADSSYAPLADRVEKVRGEERYHREHAESWMAHLADDDPGHRRLQAALDRLFPYALTLFEPVDDELEAAIDDAGFRTKSLDDLREAWLAEVGPFLESLDLSVPDADAVELPERVGRDGDHTDDWGALFEEMTAAYRELGREHAARIMEGPE